MNLDLDRTFYFLLDSALFFCLFHRISTKYPRSKGRMLAYLIIMTAIIPCYFFLWWLPGPTPRFLYRVVIYSAALSVGKGVSVVEGVFYSAEAAMIQTIYFNILQLPILRDHRAVTTLSFITILTNAAYALPILITGWLMHFERTRAITAPRWIVLFILAGCELYIKTAMEQMLTTYSDVPFQLMICFMILQLFVVAAMVLFEHFLHTREIQETERVAAAVSEYRYQAALSQKAASEDVSRLHHDMKNHLLAMQQLSGDNERLGGYVDSLMDELSSYELQIETGNTLLNGLLAEKLRVARKHEIDLTVQMDFRSCGMVLEDIDICVIFGNLLDNAIEASRKLTDPTQRSILVKSHAAAENLAITFSNFYEGTLQLSDGLPKTTKADPAHHGIGLASVRRSVEKYGGTITFRTISEHRLSVTVLLPTAPPH